ncbi:rolling circle replication-associated protein [Cellulomonas sp. P4]|uniref:rolling circle replication-associated protein n=1 Tax=Cellulomonas sp. P4 TaxID=3142533 RepID=UPI0031BA347E
MAQDVLDVNDGAVWREAYAYDASGAPVVGADGRYVRQRHMVGGAPLLSASAGLGLGEGRTFRLSVSPGTIGLRTFDAVRAEARAERERTDPRATVLSLYSPEHADADGTRDLVYMTPDGLFGGGPVAQGWITPKPGRVIAVWSSRSRARMFTTIPQLDLSEWTDESGDLAMVTLTLPGNWQAVAPTGRHFKRAIERFRSRWVRAGLDVRGLWKLEFQRRGAPHVHLLLRVPALVAGEVFEDWLSRTWAECVAADDTFCHRCDRALCTCEVSDTEFRRHLAAGTAVDYSGQRFSDPRRIATYFLGHSSKHADGKEYQHIVPSEWRADGEGPGRFWGYWGLKKGTVEVDLNMREWYAVRRMLRHVHRARAWRLDQAARRRADYHARMGDAPAPRRRYRLRNLGAAGTTSLGGGTVVVNDGIGLAYDVARALAVMRA